jgi:hypothetical protein
MKQFLISCAALAACCMSPAIAEDATTPAATAAQAQPMAAPSAAMPAQTDLTGQTIYSVDGTAIGTVASVTTDAQGQSQAVVGVEKFLGMGGKNVLFPVSSLQPRTGGGYTTSLNSSEIKKLPEASADMH